MYNKVFLIGNLTRDPEVRFTTSGIPVASFALAVNRFSRGEEGSNKQEVDFINIVAWRRLAEICGEYLKKGRPVAIEGRLQIRSFTGRDGQKRTMAEVVADGMQMLGSKPGIVSQETGVVSQELGKTPQTPSSELPTEEEDEIPF